MVKLKAIKYKHYRRALELNAQIEAGTIDEDELVVFTIELVDQWDFIDSETGQPLPVDPDIRDELSIEQFRELNALLNSTFGKSKTTVPNPNASSLSSGLIKSNHNGPPQRKRKVRQAG